MTICKSARMPWACLALGLALLPTAAIEAKTPANESAAQAADAARPHSPYHPNRVPTRAKDYYISAWGIDNLLVRKTASSELIRFSYRVVDPARAKALGDSKVEPYLIGMRSHAVLKVPVMENIGQLRQTRAEGAGKEYWMVFSNKGNLVKVGDRVDVVIGPFRASSLIVE